MADKKKKLTTAWGATVSDDQNSKTAGERGPVLMQDVHVLQKLAHFDREAKQDAGHEQQQGHHNRHPPESNISKVTLAAVVEDIDGYHQGGQEKVKPPPNPTAVKIILQKTCCPIRLCHFGLL